VRNGFLNSGSVSVLKKTAGSVLFWFGFVTATDIFCIWRADSVVLLILSLTIVRTDHHSYDGRKHNRLYCRT